MPPSATSLKGCCGTDCAEAADSRVIRGGTRGIWLEEDAGPRNDESSYEYKGAGAHVSQLVSCDMERYSANYYRIEIDEII